jgi:hypothetical protein
VSVSCIVLVSVLVSVTYIVLVSVLVSVSYIVLVFREQSMVQRIQEIVAKYEDRLREMQSVLRLSYGRRLVRTGGAPNRMFLTCLFCHHELAIQFLKDVGLIQSKVQCNTCERDVTWSADPSRCDRFRWRCRRSVAGVKCRVSTSIRHGSWFQLSNLALTEIMVITYDILCRESAHQIGERI